MRQQQLNLSPKNRVQLKPPMNSKQPLSSSPSRLLSSPKKLSRPSKCKKQSILNNWLL